MTNKNVQEKKWGYELIWTHTDHYTAKMLVFTKAGNMTSMHYHAKKTKSWFVNMGRFVLRYIDTSSGEVKMEVLSEGSTWECPAMRPHQLESMIDNSMISEVSTAEDAADIFIISPSLAAGDQA